MINRKNRAGGIDFPWLNYLGPVIFAMIGCGLALGVSGLGGKYALLLLLLPAAAASLLALARTRWIRMLLFLGMGFSIVINPNFFFKIVANAMDQFAGVGGYGLALTDLILLALVFLTFFGDSKRRPMVAERPPAPILAALFFYILWIFLSLTHAPDRSLAMAQIFFEIKYIVMFLLIGYVVLPPGRLGKTEIRAVCFGLACGVFIEAALAAAEYAGVISGQFSLLGIQVGGFVEIFQGGLTHNRVGGTFRHPNYLAGALVLLWPILLSAFLNSSGKERFFWAASLSSALGTLVMTLSRGGWAGAGAGAGVYLALTIRSRGGMELLRRNRRAILMTLVVMALVTAAFSGPIMTKVFRSDPRNIGGRQDLNRLAFFLIKEHPLTGVGILNSNIASEGSPIDQVYRISFGIPPVIHNIYLLIAAEIGLPGLIIFVWLIALILTKAFKASRRIEDPVTAQWIIGLASGLLGYMITDLFGPGLRKMEIAYLFWCQMGLLAALLRRPPPVFEAKRISDV